MPDSHFQFARRRDFGDVVGDGFQFIIKHFKSLFTGFLMYVGPLVLISIYFQGSMMTGFFDFDPTSTDTFPIQFGSNVIFYLLAMVAASIMLIALTFGAVQKYRAEPDERIIDGLWPFVSANIGRVFVAVVVLGIAYMLLMVFLFGFAGMMGVGFMLLSMLLIVPLLVYLWVPFSLVPFIYVYEDGDLADAVRRAFFLIKGHWWNTFAILFVIGLIAVIASSIFSMPAYIIGFTETLGSGGDFSEVSRGPGYYVFNAIGTFGSMFVAVYQGLGTVLQYFNLSEIKDGTGLMERIEEIDDEILD